jgi:hypothetical protein
MSVAYKPWSRGNYEMLMNYIRVHSAAAVHGATVLDPKVSPKFPERYIEGGASSKPCVYCVTMHFAPMIVLFISHDTLIESSNTQCSP